MYYTEIGQYLISFFLCMALYSTDGVDEILCLGLFTTYYVDIYTFGTFVQDKYNYDQARLR